MKVYKTLTDGIEIVEYEDSLAQAVADMWNKSGEGWGGSFDNGVYTAERMIAKRASGMFFNVYVAIKDGEALGYCSFNRYYKDADTGYVHLLNVRPDYHGKGLGKELVLMCVNETIARGMPRLDIHTWPGNTKAMPMYKKCGYFWEDRADTTHLSNFIPTVLATEPVKDFFKTADWYTDSTRKIEIEPDGKKVNKFELYEYEWEKDGVHLRVGFEKTGRRINLIETDDYRIELTAKNHELAYGLNYPCKFIISNKSGKELDVKINGKSNDVITFEGSWSGIVSDETTFDGTFFVNPITEEQDDMRMHPCILADVSINGKSAEFGLGIEPKFPVTINLSRKERIAQVGITEDIYINIKNSLPTDATVKFALPKSPLLQIPQSDYEVRLVDGKGVSLATSALIRDYGYTSIPVSYKINMDDGQAIDMTRPLHIVNQGLTGAFGFETDKYFGATNGLWRLRMNKKNNEVKLDRLISTGFGVFYISKLGKPFDDEFNITKPSDVRVTRDGSFIRFEADFVSGKFAGAVLTEIYEFDSAGILKRNHRVTNAGTVMQDLSVATEFWTNIGRRAIFPYDGGIHAVADKMNYGFDTLDQEKIDENWIFDASDSCPSGVYWPKQYKPDFNWGEAFKFEFQAGTLSPGQHYETEPIVYMCDVFKNFKDFRNFVLGIHEERAPFLRNHLEVIVNGGNPVLSDDTLELVLRNNRQNIRGGTVTISSPNGLFKEEKQTNPDDELRYENTFNVAVTSDNTGIGLAEFSMQLSGFEFKKRRALLSTDGTTIKMDEHEGIFTVENRSLQFRASPSFSDTVYSLKYGENEWLFSNYPSLESYSWWNPFAGGLKTNLERFGNSLVLREKITAEFTTETDSLGNTWSGIRCDVYVENFDEYKGVRYSQYYLTLPGVPVMCHLLRVENGTGRFLDADLHYFLNLSGEETLTEITAEFKEGSLECKVHPGKAEEEQRYDRLVKVSRCKENQRPEKLFIFKDSANDKEEQVFEYDINIALCYASMKGNAPNGESFTTTPVFCILTEKDLTLEDLEDLKRISF